ncbi:MAG: sulfatase-like hydrolase/transferase [Anaerolineales bacterium]|nr:sulfatase-like hydrolase/transferase [Anaerolineales bacterium]
MSPDQLVSRRDFLKLASFLPMAAFANQWGDILAAGNTPEAHNVIIFVFDAWSAHHLDLYGYVRETMPNLTCFADRAIVYHNHYSAGTYTIPGTASLLSGLYPWTHRAFQVKSGVAAQHIGRQAFAVLGGKHSTTGYSQNKYADVLLGQSENYLDAHIRLSSFNLQSGYPYSQPLLKNDSQVAFSSLEANIIERGKGFDASLFIGPLYRTGKLYEKSLLVERCRERYPRGLPEVGEVFLLEGLVDGIIDTLANLDQPAFVYLHTYPPHEPYRPTAKYDGLFENDGYRPDIVAPHFLSTESNQADELRRARRSYDEYLASWDAEFGRVYRFLEESGLLGNSYVIITSDHGEMHDRGEIGHISRLIYTPLIHVPLLVSRPGQRQREDVTVNTSCVDLLPTIASLTGCPIPEWSEGQLLPGLGGSEDLLRSIFVVEAKANSSFLPLQRYSVSLTKDRYRLTSYNYPKFQGYEFFDLDRDPAESVDLYPSHPAVAVMMQDELLERLFEVNRPYRNNLLPLGFDS